MYVIRGRKNTENSPVDKCHEGEGTVFVRRLLGFGSSSLASGYSDDFDTLVNFVHETIMPAGTTIGLHLHEGSEELYYIIEGKGEMTVDGTVFVMEPGDVCLTKSGSSHAFRNIGDKDIRMIVMEAVMEPERKNK